MFNYVGILMMLNFVEDDIKELGLSEDSVISFHFDEVIEHSPYVFDKMGTETS